MPSTLLISKRLEIIPIIAYVFEMLSTHSGTLGRCVWFVTTWIIPMVTWSIDQRGKVILNLPSATYSTSSKGLLHSAFYEHTTVNIGLRRHPPGCHFLCSECVSRNYVLGCNSWNAQVWRVREILFALAAFLPLKYSLQWKRDSGRIAWLVTVLDTASLEARKAADTARPNNTWIKKKFKIAI